MFLYLVHIYAYHPVKKNFPYIRALFRNSFLITIKNGMDNDT